MFDVTGCVRYNTSRLFSSPISVPSQEISWEEHLRNDLFCVSVKCKTLTQSINLSLFCGTQSGDLISTSACNFTVFVVNALACFSVFFLHLFQKQTYADVWHCRFYQDGFCCCHKNFRSLADSMALLVTAKSLLLMHV